MALGVDFLSRFQSAIERQGGSPLMIRHMTLPQSAEKLEDLAQIAVGMHFPVPRSEVERFVVARGKKEGFTDAEIASDRLFNWGLADLEERYGVPGICFINDKSDEDSDPVPIEIVEQIVGKPLQSPLLVSYEGKQYIAIQIVGEGETANNKFCLAVGDIFESLESITLSEARYFDFNS
jgi:hypothetical protein